MANTYKNIVITPNRDTDAANVPVIRFSGGDATLNTDINLRVYTTQSGTLSFEGSAGQLFSITNDLTNSIFSVNDVSGIPSIDVFANGDILLAPFGGQIVVGNTTNLNFDSTRSTKIVDPVANTLAFHTAQTERVRIDPTGNLLIGRTNSTMGQRVILDVAGAANASAYLTGTGQAVLNNSTTLISTGYTVSTFNAGSNISAYGTWQPNAANGNYQVVTANGAVTITTPPANCAIDILFINASNRNPGSVSFSGYNVSASPGSTYAVTANQRYILSIREINSISTYSWYAMQ